MIFLSVCNSDTCLFVQWRHNPYKYFDFCGGEPTNAACAPSTATSDVLNHYTIEASPKKPTPLYTLFEHPFLPAFVGSPPIEVEIFIWIMSPLYKKTSVAVTD